MDKCPKCNQLVGDGLGVHYNSDIVRNGLDTIRRLRRQLAQRDSRIAELEATIDEWEQKAANWMASPEAQKQLDGYRELSMKAMRAEDDAAALRAEVAALKAECAEAWRVHSEVVAELKAKLAKYTEPLTPMQADDISREFNGHGKLVMDMDAAIRRVRRGGVMTAMSESPDKCPKCGAPEKLGMIQDWSCGSIEEEDESVTEYETCLRRQLAAANERVGRLQAQMVELREAWADYAPDALDGRLISLHGVTAHRSWPKLTRILGGA